MNAQQKEDLDILTAVAVSALLFILLIAIASGGGMLK